MIVCWTAWQLHDDCLTTAWRLLDDCLTTAWQNAYLFAAIDWFFSLKSFPGRLVWIHSLPVIRSLAVINTSLVDYSFSYFAQFGHNFYIFVFAVKKERKIRYPYLACSLLKEKKVVKSCEKNAHRIMHIALDKKIAKKFGKVP